MAIMSTPFIQVFNRAKSNALAGKKLSSWTVQRLDGTKMMITFQEFSWAR